MRRRFDPYLHCREAYYSSVYIKNIERSAIKMKITDYPKIQEAIASNIMLLDGDTGTKTIYANALAESLLKLLTPKQQVSQLDMEQLDQTVKLHANDRLLVGISSEGKVKAIKPKDLYFSLIDVLSESVLGGWARKAIYGHRNLGGGLLLKNNGLLFDQELLKISS